MSTGNDVLLVHIAALGAGEHLSASGDAGSGMEDRLGVAVAAGGLIHGCRQSDEALLHQDHRAGLADHGPIGNVVGGIVGTDRIGVLTGTDASEVGSIVDSAVQEGIGVIRHRIGSAGELGAIQAEAIMDIHRHAGQGVPGSSDIAPDQEVVAHHMAGGVRRTTQRDVIGQIRHIPGVRCQDMAHHAGLGDHLVPKLCNGVLIDADDGVHIAAAGSLQDSGGGLGSAVAGQAHDRTHRRHSHLTIGTIAGAAAGIAGLDLGGGRQQRRLSAGIGGGADTGMVAIGVPDGAEIREGQGVVHIPVPLLRDVGPHTIPEAVVFAAAVGIVAAVPDLLLGADTGVVTPDQEVSTAQIGSRNVRHILGVVALLADISGVPLVPDVLLIGMVEGPLAVPNASGIGPGAGLTQGVIGAGLDTVIDDPPLVHIVAHRLRMVAGGTGAGVEGRIPVLDLDIVRVGVVGSAIAGTAQEVVVHPHGVVHGVQKGVQLIDVTHEIGIAPGVAIIGRDVRRTQLHLIRADAHVVRAGILLEEVGDVDIQLEDEGLSQIPLDVDGRVVGPLQIRGPVPGIGIVDDTIHIRGIVGLVVIGGVEGVIGVGIVVLLEGPGHVVQMGGTIEARDHLDVVLSGSLQDLHHLSGGQILALIRVVLVGGQGPGGVIGAADPGKVVLRLELALIVSLVPQIEPEAGVIGEVELQSVVAHPRHLTDEVADPILGVVLTAAVQADGALHSIRYIRSRESLDGVGIRVTQMLLQHIGTVDQAPHITGGDLGDGAHLQLVALRGHAGSSIHTDHDIALVDPALRAPDDVHGLSRGPPIRLILPSDQLDGLQQVAGGLRVRDHEDAAAFIKCEGLAVCDIAVDDLPHRRGIHCCGYRKRREHANDHDEQHDQRNDASRSLTHDLFPFLWQVSIPVPGIRSQTKASSKQTDLFHYHSIISYP